VKCRQTAMSSLHTPKSQQQQPADKPRRTLCPNEGTRHRASSPEVLVAVVIPSAAFWGSPALRALRLISAHQTANPATIAASAAAPSAAPAITPAAGGRRRGRAPQAECLERAEGGQVAVKLAQRWRPLKLFVLVGQRWVEGWLGLIGDEGRRMRVWWEPQQIINHQSARIPIHSRQSAP